MNIKNEPQRTLRRTLEPKYFAPYLSGERRKKINNFNVSV
jgi:hypothetical protein